MDLLHGERIWQEMNKQTGVSISLENYEKVKADAKERERSMSWIINKALDLYYLRKQELKEGKA